MAIYSLHHGAIGRRTHRAGTAGVHASYITRSSAAGAVIGQHMPTGYRSARAWLDRQERDDRKNARVIDKVMLALPLELTPEQRLDLVREFARVVGRGRISWLAAIHDKGRDAHNNPHAHLILRDRDIASGRRVALLSEQGSTERLRVAWERCVNRALEAQGRPERVTRLSLAAQGAKRIPERHRGPERHSGNGRQNGVVRTYGFSPQTQRAPAVTPAAFVEAGRTLTRSEPFSGPVRPRADTTGPPAAAWRTAGHDLASRDRAVFLNLVSSPEPRRGCRGSIRGRGGGENYLGFGE